MAATSTTYYLQLAPVLSLLGGVGLARLLETRNRLGLGLFGALAVSTVVVTTPLRSIRRARRRERSGPRDSHLVEDRAVAATCGPTRSPRQDLRGVGAASIYYLADRDPALRHMWPRNIQAQQGALVEARSLLATWVPKLVILAQKPSDVDKGGVTDRILRYEYERAATIDGVRIYQPRT